MGDIESIKKCGKVTWELLPDSSAIYSAGNISYELRARAIVELNNKEYQTVVVIDDKRFWENTSYIQHITRNFLTDVILKEMDVIGNDDIKVKRLTSMQRMFLDEVYNSGVNLISDRKEDLSKILKQDYYTDKEAEWLNGIAKKVREANENI